MSYKRSDIPDVFSQGAALDNDLAGMGIYISCDKPSVAPNIEDTLIAASIDELILGNSRVLALITDWMEIHFARINVERLFRAITSLDPKKYGPIYIFWTAMAQFLSKDRRFLKLSTLYKGEKTAFLSLSKRLDVTNELIRKNGEDDRFKNTCLVVPNGVIRRRPKSIMSAREISAMHMPFRYRVIMGPSFRADMWALLKRHPSLSAYEVAKNTYGAYESARQVKLDYLIVKKDRIPF